MRRLPRIYNTQHQIKLGPRTRIRLFACAAHADAEADEIIRAANQCRIGVDEAKISRNKTVTIA